MNFEVLEPEFVICKIESFEEVSIHDEFCFITKTDEEISLICTTRYTPQRTIAIQKNYRGIRLKGPLEFNTVGTIAKLISLLSLNDISVLSVSTYNSEYIFLKNSRLGKAVDILIANNYELIG
ncbi:MAG: ACT domain-containing protein [bacterium]